MSSLDSFQARRTLTVNGTPYTYFSLPETGLPVEKLPFFPENPAGKSLAS